MAQKETQHLLGQTPIRPTPANPQPVNFGSNVIVFDPSDLTIGTQTQQILGSQTQFGNGRVAFFFKPGVYSNLTVNIGYYTTVSCHLS